MSKKIKILFICPTLQGGGSERFMSILVNNLNTEQFEPILAIVNNEEQFYAIDTNRVRLIDLKTPFIKNALPKVMRLIWKERPDIVFSNMTKLNIFIATFRPLFPFKTRFIARESNVVSVDNQTAFPNQLKQINWLIRSFYKRFDAIVCQSIDMRDDLVAVYNVNPQKITLINNPVDVERISQLAASPSIEKINKPRFIGVGRLAVAKGFDRLLKAVSLLDFDFEFNIVGKGDDDKVLELKNLVQTLNLTSRVHFLGQLSNPFPLIASSDVFLLGSRYEGFPNVLLEAGACGVPIVAFNSLGGTREMVQNGVNGFLVPDDDIPEFAAKIKTVLDRRFESKTIQKDTENRFGLKKIITLYERLLLDSL